MRERPREGQTICNASAEFPVNYNNLIAFISASRAFPGIDETIREVQAIGGICTGYIVDISKKEEVYAAADLIRRDVGDVSGDLVLCGHFVWYVYVIYEPSLYVRCKKQLRAGLLFRHIRRSLARVTLA